MSTFGSKNLLKYAPTETKMIAGIPKYRARFLSNPFLKKAILVTLLERWYKAVMPKTDWKSKKKLAMGTKNTDDPKPPTVPKTSASIESKTKTGRYLVSIIPFWILR